MTYEIYYDPEFHQYKCKYKNCWVVIDISSFMYGKTFSCPEHLVEYFYGKISDDLYPLFYEIEYYE